MRRVCVFCGSSPGDDPRFVAVARELGRELATRGIGLVFGGGSVGLMGVVADAALAAGGEVVGVIPEALDRREVAHRGLPDLRVVGSMHERKALMAELSDAFVLLPGGFGSLDEFVEALTWNQLGIHAKPCGIVNVGGYYALLLAWIDAAVERRFVRAEHRDALVVADDPGRVLDGLAATTITYAAKWIDRDAPLTP
ncbi:MAG TPA: TIGR00730 family Rossman fold protein [Acidimicrobiia bacterium]|nr:TIGR00730 family Rossman fold protein [Acidimicrobiia bacterium]